MRKKISITLGDLHLWEAMSQTLGYGEKGKYKLLRRMLEVAEEMPTLFRRR